MIPLTISIILTAPAIPLLRPVLCADSEPVLGITWTCSKVKIFTLVSLARLSVVSFLWRKCSKKEGLLKQVMRVATTCSTLDWAFWNRFQYEICLAKSLYQNKWKYYSAPHVALNVAYQHYILSNIIKNIYANKLSIQLWFSIFVSERAKET